MKNNGATVLVDRFGRGLSPARGPQASSWQFFEGADRWRDGDTQPQWFWNGAQDTQKLLSTATWRDAMSSARWVLANFPLIRGALMEQATYSFPLEPHYIGKDQEWGRLAKRWLRDWKKSSDIRGSPYNCHTAARIRLLARKTDGDVGRILTVDPDNEYPRLQFVRAHRIGTIDADDGKVKSGPYRGKRICNGVIVDDWLRTLAYRIIGEVKSNGDRDYQDVPAPFMRLTYNPDYSDQHRGISEMLSGMATTTEIRRWRAAEIRAQQLQANEAIAEDNEDGEAPPGADYSVKSSSGTSFQYLDKGQVRYYRAGAGNKLTLHRPDRPGPGSIAYEDRIITSLFYGLEWDPFFALAIKEPGGAWARLVVKKANRAVKNNQRIEAADELWEDTGALANAIYRLKILPAPSDGDIFSWDYSGPPEFSADTGNDEQAKREKYKIGLLTKRQLCAEEGSFWEEVDDQREIEVRSLLTRSRAIQKEFPELTLQECMGLFEQRTPNGVVSNQSGGSNQDEGAGAQPQNQ